MSGPAGSLAGFLLARIAEDEAFAHEDLADYGPEGDDVDNLRAPSRWLAECEAKRRIVELHTLDHECTVPGDGYAGVFGSMPGTRLTECPTLRLLALPFADHPDYEEKWKI